jgi:hypothetical protein
MDTYIDEPVIRKLAEKAFEFHLIRHPHSEARKLLGTDDIIGSLTPLELLNRYWSTIKLKPFDTEPINKIAASIIESAVSGQPPEDE